MENDDRHTVESLPSPWLAGQRLRYEEQIRAIRETFEAHARHIHAGGAAVEARSAAVDGLIREIWEEVQPAGERLAGGISLVAVGGFGRRELFPYSDVDLMFLLDPRVSERSARAAIQRVNQLLWDAGLRISALTRTLTECERLDPENVEFTLALMDARPIAGDEALTTRLLERSVPKVVARDARKISARLLELIRARHARYGDTLFHLEPNIKECPGGLRDAHACTWLARLGGARNQDPREDREFREAREFVLLVRTFLHLRHGRDDNTLDWQAQDAAAAGSLGIGRGSDPKASVDAAFWMRQYFRHARSIERVMAQFLEDATPARGRGRALPGRAATVPANSGFEVSQHRIAFLPQTNDPACDPEVVLAVFGAMAATGAGLSVDAERRIEQALPVLSAHLEDGPNLWRLLQRILTGRFAGEALRTMHALGILELVIPEFHGIDALVIRDAYHRYTVDEHTFVLIDTLRWLGAAAGARNSGAPPAGLAPWETRFGALFRDLPHPELLLLASLLHDTGKGHATEEHAAESTRMAANVLQRLELDAYETALVLDLIRHHLEMSAALRRDVFDQETIRSFAARVPNPEALRMLALFTYADINAVHPDALTPWKAENLWRLYNATANYLDRNVDDERVAVEANTELRELMHRIHALMPNSKANVNVYLEGFPQRYLQTRTPDVVRRHVEMASALERRPEGIELDFRYAPGVSELTLITRDRPMLFATIAGALAGWGMNIVTADAFSNAHGLVVDSFRFSDTFRTLEFNEPERERFVVSVGDLVAGKSDLEALLALRKRGRRKTAKTRVESRVDFDDAASSQSTLMQVVAQDTPGLLRALSLTLAEQGCNIEVALVDTEGETAIDVFYLRRAGGKLDGGQQESLRLALLEAIEGNAR
jgi:[protein-PII] uridylyltransferase